MKTEDRRAVDDGPYARTLQRPYVMLESLKAAFATLFVTIDPSGVAPIFLALTAGMTASARREVALRATGIAFIILVIFAFAGRSIIDLLVDRI